MSRRLLALSAAAATVLTLAACDDNGGDDGDDSGAQAAGGAAVTEEEGLSLICTLHQLQLARAYGHRMVALREGRVELDTYMHQVEDKQLEGLYTEEDEARSDVNDDQHEPLEPSLSGAVR